MRIALALLLLAVTAPAQVMRTSDGLTYWAALDQPVDVINGSTLTFNSPAAIGQSRIGRGLITGTTGWVSGRAPGTYVSVSNGAISAWVWSATASTSETFSSTNPRYIFSRGTNINSATFFGVRVLGGKLSVLWRNPSSTAYIERSSSSHVVGAGWAHIAVAFTGTNTTMYVNGSVVSHDVTGEWEAYDGGDPTYYLSRETGTVRRWWNGIIDDVRVYNRSLSQHEIATLVNSRRRNHSQ